MNIVLWLIRNSKTEIKVILASLALLIALPAIGVVVIATSGLQVAADALVALNPITRLVDVFDTNGNKIGEVEVTTNWPATGYVTDEFGTHESFREALGLGPHTGIDVANTIGSPVTPIMAGTVVYTDAIDDNACGIHIKLRHEHNITSLYCHLSEVVTIAPGTQIAPGDQIGAMGNSGVSTGSHVHLSTYVYGIAVNPRIFLSGEPEAPFNGLPTY